MITTLQLFVAVILIILTFDKIDEGEFGLALINALLAVVITLSTLAGLVA